MTWRMFTNRYTKNISTRNINFGAVFATSLAWPRMHVLQ
jgi:hypothetical protein